MCVVFKITSWVLMCLSHRQAKLELKVRSLNSDLHSRTNSPWKDFCNIKKVKEDWHLWTKANQKMLWYEYKMAVRRRYIKKKEGGVWFYVSDTCYDKALRMWRK